MKLALTYGKEIGFVIALLSALFFQNYTTEAYHACDGYTGSVRDSCLANSGNAHAGTGGNTGGTGQNTGGTGQNSGVRIMNPLQSETVEAFLIKIIDIILIFALPVIIFFIIYSGFLFVTARGNESKITEARTALTWALIGGVVILGARVIITVIQGTVEAL